MDYSKENQNWDSLSYVEKNHQLYLSLRHSSITYKLKLNGGDVKAVQGDSGHSQTSMVTWRVPRYQLW